MEWTVIGKTGLEVYRLGFGGIPIQRVDEDEAVAITVILGPRSVRVLSIY